MMKTDVLVIGSGAGGTVTALTLAEAGREVVVLEEGARFSIADYGRTPTVAMGRMFRARGMNPIMGSVPVAYAEGCCVGGSTEINSGFWSRPPAELLAHWKYEFNLAEASESDLVEHYAWAERELGVGLFGRPWPPSTAVFDRGLRAMGWKGGEQPRAAPGCNNTNTCAQGCPTAAKQGMSVRLLPRAERATASNGSCATARASAACAPACWTARTPGAGSRSPPGTSSSAAGRPKRRRCCAAAASPTRSATP